MVTIKRIKEIKNVGVFSDFPNGGPLGFEKLTFIYGFNTYGKTTLVDIFQSLKENNSKIIQKRKTIPTQTGNQKVVLSVKNEYESDLKFENNNWALTTISKNLEVFGTAFIHKNLFTGLTIERANKENFTQFILGENGVEIAEKIASDKKELGDKKRTLKTKLPSFIKDKKDNEIKAFLEFSLEGLDKNKIENTLAQKMLDLQKERERFKEPQKIIQIQSPDKFEIPVFNIVEILSSINCLLQEGYPNIREDALVKFNKHLSDNFSNSHNAENWIRIGLSYCKDFTNGDCVFCGQNLKNAHELISTYNEYFNQAYNAYIDRIERDLKKQKEKLEQVNFAEKAALQMILTKMLLYKELIADEGFQIGLKKLQTNIELLQEINIDKKEILKVVISSCDIKIKSPCKKVDSINFSQFETALSAYNNLLITIKEIIDILLEKIIAFKKHYGNTVGIAQSIKLLEEEIDELKYKKARIDENENCKNYKTLEKEVVDLNSNIIALEAQLKINQSDYIKLYFNEINKLFKSFGGKNFFLEKEEDGRGHLPVYSLKIKFHGSEILNDQLESVFSESDRRALALSIFWAKINLKSDEEKAKTIIVLDDPLTSFDENRITTSINLFKSSLNSISQMIVLTHYSNFIKRFCEITKDTQIATQYLEIRQDNMGSSLSLSNRNKFTMNEYQKTFLKICGYINGEHSSCIKTDLRPFLENLYLPTIFAKKIKDKNVDCSTLDGAIEGIFDNEKIKNKFHEFRNTLNPDSHIFTTNNAEDVRNFARDMMEYLYSFNHEMANEE
ncbi:MAG: hypothetical protein K0Q57_99 [Gammaproteobacteria bacterium]|jgi:wobble nucleotide-excising tRNase|nr:hypothetical protein [Gammaproteobacteria bacterium]